MADSERASGLDKPPQSMMDGAAALFLWVEHVAYIALGILLCITALLALAGAGMLMMHGLADWTGTDTIFVIIDRLLFVLMLIEIMHTVRASLNSGSLKCEPFLVVGLIASIRRVLVITLKSSDFTRSPGAAEAAQQQFQSAMIELGVLGFLILVMVISIYVLHRTGASDRAGAAG